MQCATGYLYSDNANVHIVYYSLMCMRFYNIKPLFLWILTFCIWFINPCLSNLWCSVQPSWNYISAWLHLFLDKIGVLIGVILNCTFYDNESFKRYCTAVHDPVPSDSSLPDFISHRGPGAFLSNLSVSAQGCHYSHYLSPLWPLNSYQLGFYILQSTSSLSPEHDTVTVLLVKLTVLMSANWLWCHHQKKMWACLS